MAEDDQANAHALDPSIADLIRALAALLDEVNLSEIEYAEGDRRVRVARASAPPASLQTAAPTGPASVSAAATAKELPGTVKAPMVGTVYLAPQPDAAPFIKVGDSVREGQALLIIEAMKVMNQIAAPRAGRVAAILVADGMPVEFGQPLIVLE